MVSFDSNEPDGTSVTLPVPDTGENDNPTVDFGYYTSACEGKIGNYVWIDANKNGIQDGGELPFPV